MCWLLYAVYSLLFAVCVFLCCSLLLGVFSCFVCCALFLNADCRVLIVPRGLLVVVCGLSFVVRLLFVV